jgi:hypothetical protein
MGGQAARQAARRKVSEALAIKQRERATREKRLSESAVSVVVALVERDEAVVAKERQAAGAIALMLAEGLGTAEIAEWCGGLEAREVARLAKLSNVADASADARVG